MSKRNSAKSQAPSWLTVTAIILVLLLAVALIVSSLSGGWTDFSKFQPDETGQEQDSGAILTPDDGEGGIKLMTTLIAREDFGVYGISPLADTAYTVTATVNGTNLTEDQKNVTWAQPAFANAGSDWATGKTVSEYVTLNAQGNQATITCLKAFGEQIIVTATSTYNTAVSGSLTVDYKEKIEFTGLQLDSKAVTGTITEVLNITGDRNATVTGSFSHSEAYTIKGDVVSVEVKFERSTQLTSAVTSAFADRFPEYTATITSDAPTATINDFLDKEAHNSIFLNGYPTSFTAANMKTVYDGLKTMASSSQAHYTVTATPASGTAQQLGSLQLNFDEIKTWYEAFTDLKIDFDEYNNGLIF